MTAATVTWRDELGETPFPTTLEGLLGITADLGAVSGSGPAGAVAAYTVRTAPAASSLLEAGNADAVLVDAQRPVVRARPVPPPVELGRSIPSWRW